jgi:hypothetical protein
MEDHTTGTAKGFFSSTLAKVAALLIGIALFLGGFALFNNTNDGDSQNTAKEDSSIEQQNAEEATPEAEVSYVPAAKPEVFVINPLRDTILYLLSGTSFSIPANTIVDQNGDLLSNEVTINIHEIIEAHEIIANDVSMRYFDEQQEEQWLQTAGMFDVQAYSEGKPLKIAEGKGIDVSLVSPVGGSYDFWQFDEASGNWVKQDNASNVSRLIPANEPLKKEIAELKSLTAKRPLPPRNYKNYKYDVSTIDLSACPELKQQAGSHLYLTFAGQQTSQALDNNDWVSRRRWSKRSLKQSSLGEGIYEFTWIGDTIFTTYVRASQATGISEATKDQYEEKLAEYERNLTRLNEKEEILERQASFTRAVRIQGFGLYNFDVILKRQDVVRLIAAFNIGDAAIAEEALQSMQVFLVTGDERVVIKYPAQLWENFVFSADADNQLLVFLPHNRVGVFTQDDFEREMRNIKQAANSHSPYEFDMHILDEEVHSLDDLSKVVANSSET